MDPRVKPAGDEEMGTALALPHDMTCHAAARAAQYRVSRNNPPEMTS